MERGEGSAIHVKEGNIQEEANGGSQHDAKAWQDRWKSLWQPHVPPSPS